VHLPSLAAELPEGWTVSDGATLASPSGTDIHLKLGRAPEGWTAKDVADDMQSATRAGLQAINGSTSKTVTLRRGVIAEDRRFQFDRDGVTWVTRAVCSVDAGLALTIRASWPATNDAADDEVDVAVAGLRVMSRPISATPEVSDAPTPVAPQRRPAVDGATWSDLRARWAASDPDEAASPTDVTRWSTAELAVCATILGSPSFPTVGSELLSSLPDAALTATLEWVTRSLLARRLIMSVDGTTKICDELRDMMEAAVFPDLTISVERLDAGGATGWWFGVRPDRAVQVTVEADGSRECAVVEPAEVVAHVVAHMCADGVGGGSLDNAADVVAMARFTTAWRDGELIRGGTFALAIGAEGALALAEPDPGGESPGWTLHPTDPAALRVTLIEHLPGA
jgi:hypothetical protein